MKTHIFLATALLFAGGAAAQGQAPAQPQQQPPPAQTQQQPAAAQQLPAAQAQRPNQAQAGVVVHLSEFGTNFHRVQMALSTAHALQARGTPTTLLLDVDGVHLADRNTPLSLSQLHAEGGGQVASANQGRPQDEIQPVGGGGETGSTFEDLYQQFVSAGGQVIVRQHCASLAGMERNRLRQGARLVNDREIADVVANAARVVDY
jgi:predicted peroxiredoxin